MNRENILDELRIWLVFKRDRTMYGHVYAQEVLDKINVLEEEYE